MVAIFFVCKTVKGIYLLKWKGAIIRRCILNLTNQNQCVTALKVNTAKLQRSRSITVSEQASFPLYQLPRTANFSRTHFYRCRTFSIVPKTASLCSIGKGSNSHNSYPNRAYKAHNQNSLKTYGYEAMKPRSGEDKDVSLEA
jgi:hypothetical protein